MAAHPPRRLAPFGLLGAPPLILAVMGYSRRWVAEDAFIDFRVVANLVAGHGPIFNLGERVEAYSNPLWVAWLTMWELAGIARLEYGAVALGLVFAVGGLIAAEAGAWHVVRSTGGDRSAGSVVLPVGALVFAAIPAVWDFATSGLETGLTYAWLGGTYWALARSADAGTCPRWGTSIAIGLGPLVRPDLALFSGGFFVILLIISRAGSRAGSVARAVRLAGVAAMIPGAYEIFRMGYFAALVPNTALAKEAGLANWEQGTEYLRDFVDTYWLWIPLSLIGVWWGTRSVQMVRTRAFVALALTVIPVACAALHVVYVARVGGDFMHGRFLLPTLLAALLPLAVAPVRWEAWLPRTAALVIGLWALVCGLTLRVPYAERIGPAQIADERGFYVRASKHANPVRLEDLSVVSLARSTMVFGVRADLQRAVERLEISDSDGERVGRVPALLIDLLKGARGALVMRGRALHPDIDLINVRPNIGILGYRLGPHVHLVDRWGLSDPLAARMRSEARGRPGHDKSLPLAWIVARFGDPPADIAALPEVIAARAALECGDLFELRAAVEAPLTLSRFLRNVGSAGRLTALRVSDDPVRAERELCGPSA